MRRVRRIFTLFLACTAGLVLSACSAPDLLVRELAPEQSTVSEAFSETGEASTAHSGEIYVHVCGCVKSPGVYRLDPDARGDDAVEAAGGFTEEADQSAVNLAARLEDGTQLNIPSKNATMESGSGTSSGSTGSSGALVNINSADADALITLPGIGESRAADILAYREEHGRFDSIEDIKNVSGIGDGIYSKIKDYITVS